MLLRRITEHVKAQNWFAVGLDFLIVVFGVFIGLQVANWSASRVDRTDERIFLNSLHQDIVEAEQISKRILNIRITVFNDLESAVDILFERTPWRELSNAECTAIGNSHIAGVIWTDLPSLSGLRDAGRTGILRDEVLLQNLATLMQRQEAMEKIIEAVQITTVDLPRAHPDLFEITPVIVPLGAASGLTEYDTVFVCDGKKLQQSRSVMNTVAVNIEAYDAVVNLVGVKPWAAQTSAVHEQLDETLGITHTNEVGYPMILHRITLN